MTPKKIGLAAKWRAFGTILLLVPFAVNVSAAQKPFAYSFSGWSLLSAVDANGDGEPAFHTSYKGTGTLGSFEAGSLQEFLPWGRRDLLRPEQHRV